MHQLHERETATILQSSHVRTRARGIQERRDRVAIYRLWDGLGFLYRTDREGIAARKGEILEERECEMKRYDDTREKRKKKISRKPLCTGLNILLRSRLFFFSRLSCLIFSSSYYFPK